MQSYIICQSVERYVDTNTYTDIRSVDTEHSGTLPWVSVEWLNQANFPFFSSGKSAGVLPFTDKMISVKYQEQDINREHAASDRQKKKHKELSLHMTSTSVWKLHHVD